MKKILIAAMVLASFGASAQVVGQQQQTSSTSVSTAAAQNAGNSQQITVAPVTTNYASDLKDQGATAAATSAAAAERMNGVNAATSLEIAKIQAGTDGTRDLSADQRAALDRAAAIEIARLGQTVKNTPSIALGQLTSSNDTCMGSVSVGGSGPGFSVGLGTTYTDENCKMLKNSRELWNMGMKAASLALMCTNAGNREALELTGFVCPQTAKANKEAADQAAASKKVAESTASPAAAKAGYTGTDPIVRARFGLDSTVAAK